MCTLTLLSSTTCARRDRKYVVMKKGEICTSRKDRKEEAARSDAMASERENGWTICAVIVFLIALCAAHVTDRPACECHIP